MPGGSDADEHAFKQRLEVRDGACCDDPTCDDCPGGNTAAAGVKQRVHEGSNIDEADDCEAASHEIGGNVHPTCKEQEVVTILLRSNPKLVHKAAADSDAVEAASLTQQERQRSRPSSVPAAPSKMDDETSEELMPARLRAALERRLKSPRSADVDTHSVSSLHHGHGSTVMWSKPGQGKWQMLGVCDQH